LTLFRGSRPFLESVSLICIAFEFTILRNVWMLIFHFLTEKLIYTNKFSLTNLLLYVYYTPVMLSGPWITYSVFYIRDVVKAFIKIIHLINQLINQPIYNSSRPRVFDLIKGNYFFIKIIPPKPRQNWPFLLYETFYNLKIKLKIEFVLEKSKVKFWVLYQFFRNLV